MGMGIAWGIQSNKEQVHENLIEILVGPGAGKKGLKVAKGR